MASTIISVGNSFRIYDDAVVAHDNLPAGTYKVNFSPLGGYSLEKVENLVVGDEKVYGQHPAKLERIGRAYNRMDRSLGILMSGDKGMGKSLMIRCVAEWATTELNLPVVLVDSNSPKLADFLDTLGEVVVVFDEFEKRFSNGSGDREDEQSQFLGLFDGISTQRRIYVMTVNNPQRLNDYFVNRPGRFHYHIRFDYPTPDEVRVYLTDNAPSASAENIEEAVRSSQRTKLNYDHLRAVAFELELGGKFSDLVKDLNIERTQDTQYKITVYTSDRKQHSVFDTLDLFGAEESTSIWTGVGSNDLMEIEFDPQTITFDERNGAMEIPVDAESFDFSYISNYTSNERKIDESIKPMRVTVELRQVVREGF